MFEIVESYILSKFDELNARFDTELKVLRIDNEFQAENVSASQSDYNYQIYINGVEFSNEYESAESFSAEITLELFFNVIGKNQQAYKDKFDLYVMPLVSLFVTDSRGLNYTDPNNTSARITGIETVSVINSDRFIDDYYRPAIRLEFNGWIEPAAGNEQFSKLVKTG